MKKTRFAEVIGILVLAAGILVSFPNLRSFIRAGSASIVYEPPVLRDGVMHVACIGDSITYGAGVMDAEGWRSEESTWPYMLEERFDHGVQILNYGICGRTLVKESGDGYADTDFCRLSRECGADGYLIMLGTNDSKTGIWDSAAYEAELEEFAKSYLDLPQNPDVVLVTPPCAFAEEGSDTAVYDIQPAVIRDEVVPIIKRVAGKLGIRCFDLYAETESHPEWFTDGVHPNLEGNQAIADFLHQSIMR